MIDRPLLNHTDIAARIPHAGSMCLLGAVVFWDADRIVCSAASHVASDHPLRAADGSLGIAAGIEYAAQAMAVHGSLLTEQAALNAGLAASKPAPGMLASVRAVEMHARRLDDVAQVLYVEATRVVSDAQALVYAFELFVFETRDGEDRTDLANQPDKSGEQPSSLRAPTRHFREPTDAAVQSGQTRPHTSRRLLLGGRASVILLPHPS